MTHLNRRTVLAAALAQAGWLTLAPAPSLAATRWVVGNVTGLYPVEVARIATPRSTDEVAKLVLQWPGRIGVGGGRFSMGGQVAVPGGLHLDMRQLNGLVWLKPDEGVARVQAGMRWRDLQDHLDPLGLAVKTMQSYANFTVGGSVSVNAHGRYVGHGPVGNTVRALQLVLADGTVVEATREQHAELFHAAIGGYGATSVITEVELGLARNVRIERHVQAVPLADYPAYFRDTVRADPRAVLHNADLLPPAFDAPVCVTWLRAVDTTALTVPERLVPRGASYAKHQNAIWAMTELPGGAALRRSVVQPMLSGPRVVQWLNHEASLDAAELEPRTRVMSTYALQEYFVPERHFLPFVAAMRRVLAEPDVAVLNVSVRHSPADASALLPWAREDVFSFVLYYKQRTWASAQRRVGEWTRQLIDAALRYEGRYYLPYQLHATRAQFDAAYPEAAALRRLKARVDAAGRFSNALWQKYL